MDNATKAREMYQSASLNMHQRLVHYKHFEPELHGLQSHACKNITLSS